jgi:uncharacterized protein (DUF1330 family)
MNGRTMMAKGYWIAGVDVKDMDGYKPYTIAIQPIFKKFGARYLTRGGQSESVEGQNRSRNVIIEFPDYAAALACYRSPEYQEAKKLRTSASDGDIVVVEGYDGPQP